MKIKLFCFFYNEAALLPYFLSHYRWVDEIHAIVSQSTDGTNDMLRRAQELGTELRVPRCPHIIIDNWEFPDGKMNDFLKVAKLNEVIQRSDADWHLVVDADELVFPNFPGAVCTCRQFMTDVAADENVLMARMWNVFRHETDPDLDPNREPVVLQRRHGLADINHPENYPYHKPVFTRPNLGFTYGPGNHFLSHNSRLKVSALEFRGVHWQNADPSFCVERRIQGRRNRQSAVNKQHGLGIQHHFVTEENILALCQSHEQDPLCF
jgi:hypothetical protein